jgi:S-adenosylmethionine:tRNA ribosyltransferase-isomerase
MNALAFNLPAALEAREPPEYRGLEADEVRLLVARRARRAPRAHQAIEHRIFSDLPNLLAPGDLLVVNVSATLPAAVPAQRATGDAVRVHFATRAPQLAPPWWVVEVRTEDGACPLRATPPETITLKGGATLDLIAPYASGQRLTLARLAASEPVIDYLYRHGEPIRYGYVKHRWPLSSYQNVYATTPGSAEMPSAGRPLTRRLITAMAERGISLAPITLHTGVSSPERDEPPFAEYYEVPRTTAARIHATRARSGRVIAVGTTVVRALETAPNGGEGWTNLVITPGRPPETVDGLITGWHEPEASHLQMLEAIAGPLLLQASYAAALRHGYLWHEFGDSHLILR